MQHDLSRWRSRELHDVEADGRRLSTNRDPPGQKSLYIRPGDPARETYRLSTFQHFPLDSPIDPFQFASNGFFYTGYRDRVKCFRQIQQSESLFCGQCIENWLPGDDVTSLEWHHIDCDFKSGRDERNISIFDFARRKLQTTGDHQRKSIDANRQLDTALSSSKLTSLRNNPVNTTNNITTLISTSCDSSTAVVTTTQMASTPNLIGSLVPNRQTATASLTNQRQQTSKISSQKNNLESEFFCRNPINPHMQSKETRLQTFLDNITRWPANLVQATPEDIAEAGMFYLGERDRVKCWYCNGGLQNWERDDIPWVEHAKWFPLCEFVLQQKGVEFVRNIVSRHRHLSRPTLYNPTTSASARELGRMVNHPLNSLTVPLENASSSPPIIVDPREEINKRNRFVDEEIKSSDIVAQARLLGFADNVIRSAIIKKYEDDKTRFVRFENLVDVILSLPDGHEAALPENENNFEASCSTSVKQLSTSNEMERLEEMKLCKVCHQEDACMVFIPCGHLICCMKCGDKVRKCPVCKETIRQRVRSFIS